MGSKLGNRERIAVHQIHPVKLACDIGASFASTVLWQGRTLTGLLVHYASPPIGSAAMLRFADLERLSGTPRGRYLLVHMPPTAIALRVAGDEVMLVAGARRSPKLLLAGAAMVLAGWSHGLKPS